MKYFIHYMHTLYGVVVKTNINPLKCSGVRQLHLKMFNAIQV